MAQSKLLLAFVVLMGFYGAEAVQVCPFPAVNIAGQGPMCGTGLTYDMAKNMCCRDEPVVPGATGNYCNLAAMISANDYRCPDTHPLDRTKNPPMCCGPNPITMAEMQQAMQNAVAQAAAAAAATANAANGGANANCVDKAAPGRASDCPANANLCNNALYMTLMTEQCPKTCNRCPAAGTATGTNAATGANVRGNGCVDGTNASGVSECPQNAFRCTQPIWSTFMMQECPFTCNPSCKTNSATTTTTTTTTTTAAPGK